MENKIKTRSKIIAILILIVTILSCVCPIFAATATFVGGQYDSGMRTSDSDNNILVRRLINQTTGEKYTVFCAEHGANFKTGVQVTGEYYTPTTEATKKACKIAYLGWYKNNPYYVIDGGILASDMIWVKWDYAFTQQLIWEVLGQSNGYFIKADEQEGYLNFKSRILGELEQMEKEPSFSGQEITLDIGETKEVIDENGVLCNYKSVNSEVNGLTIKHDEGSNSLFITANSNIQEENINISDSSLKGIGLIKNGTEGEDTNIYFAFEGDEQDQLYALRYSDPVSLYLRLKVNQFGGLELSKLNTEGDLISGAVFNVTGPDGYNKDVTVTNGKITLDNLKKGTYTIKEITAPPGYILDTKAYKVEVRINETATQAIINDEPTGTFTLVKKNADKSINLEGAKYRIWNDNYDKTFTTNDNGEIKVDGLKLGKYNYQEIKAPEGYLVDDTIFSFELKYKDQNTSVIYETEERTDKEPTGTFTLVKKNSDKSANLKGAEYRIWNDNYDKTFTTNNNGEIKVEGLKLGKYNYQETKAPDGYLLDDTVYSFELTYKDQNTAVVYASTERTDEEPTGTITIIKKDAETGSTPQGDAVFEGAVYKVYAKEDIYNKAKTKKFYSNGDLVATRTMNEKGTTEDITNLPLGKYLVKEEVAPKGYMLDTKEYDVTLSYKDQHEEIISNTTTSFEKVKEMGLHIFKSGIKENSGVTSGLAGAEFTIKLNSSVEEAYEQGYTYAEVWNEIDENGNQVEVDSKRVAEAQVIAPTIETIITDENGDAYTQNNLPYGKYIVKETKTPEDYETSVDFIFSITEDESEVEEIAKKTKHIVVNNEQLETYIKLIKKDKKTGKLVTLNSTTFEIKATEDIYDRATNKILFKEGEVISQKVGNTTYTSFTTNADNIVVPDNSYNSESDNKAEVTTPLKLPVGSYEITEIKVPDGFLQLDVPVTFEIKNIKDYDTDQDGDFIKEIVINNEQPTGTINLDKTIAIREDVDTSLVGISDLSGIEFKLTAKEDILDKADGSVIYKKGQEIKTYNLSKDGKLTITDLQMGTYEIEEIKTLDGLVLNTTKYEVKFEQKDLTTKVYDSKLDVTNDTTLVEFSKTDITGEKELTGATLTVLDNENNVIDTWTSTEGTHKIEGLTVGKEYTLKEEIAPDAYVLATEINFKVEETNEIQKVTMIDKVVEISKEDISGNEIEGAKLQVLDKDGNVIDAWISEKEAHKVKGLKENETYILHEEIAIGNYVKASDIEFTISEDKETQKVVMIDKLVEITKTDLTTGEELEGAELEVIDEEENVIDKWTSTQEPHQIKGLEEEKTYILKETTAPYGYEITEEIEFTVTTDKETQKIEMKDMPILKNIKVIKVDSETKETIKDKFTFTIYENPECTKLIKEIQSNKEDGTAIFEDLRYGIYYIKETKAPTDYELSSKVVKVEINDKGIFIDDKQKEEKDGTVEFTFENKKIEVPKTGDDSNMKLFAGLGLLSLLGITCILIHNHKKNKEE